MGEEAAALLLVIIMVVGVLPLALEDAIIVDMMDTGLETARLGIGRTSAIDVEKEAILSGIVVIAQGHAPILFYPLNLVVLKLHFDAFSFVSYHSFPGFIMDMIYYRHQSRSRSRSPVARRRKSRSRSDDQSRRYGQHFVSFWLF